MRQLGVVSGSGHLGIEGRRASRRPRVFAFDRADPANSGSILQTPRQSLPLGVVPVTHPQSLGPSGQNPLDLT